MADSNYYDKYIKYKTRYVELKELAKELEGGARSLLLVFSSEQSPDVVTIIKRTEERIQKTLEKRMADLKQTDYNNYFKKNPNASPESFEDVWAKSEPKYIKREETKIRTQEIPMYDSAQLLNKDLNTKGFFVSGTTALQISAQNNQTKFVNEYTKAIRLLQSNKTKLEKNSESLKSTLVSVLTNSIKSPQQIISKLPELSDLENASNAKTNLANIIDSFSFDGELESVGKAVENLVAKYNQLIDSLQEVFNRDMPQGSYFQPIKVSQNANTMANASAIVEELNTYTNKVYKLDTAVLLQISNSKHVYLLDTKAETSSQQEEDGQRKGRQRYNEQAEPTQEVDTQEQTADQ